MTLRNLTEILLMLTLNGCNNCSDLKHSMSVLQDSLLELKEEMLQQKAFSDLILSSPTTSEKSVSSIFKKKVGPIETKLNGIRADLDQLRSAVDEQNLILERLINFKAQFSDELNMIQSTTLKVLSSANSANKERIETLEIGQENLTKATKGIAKSALNQSHASTQELKHELRPIVEAIETTSASNSFRIETLEINLEDTIQALNAAEQPAVNNTPARRHSIVLPQGTPSQHPIVKNPEYSVTAPAMPQHVQVKASSSKQRCPGQRWLIKATRHHSQWQTSRT